jgi:hypothetical protein
MVLILLVFSRPSCVRPNIYPNGRHGLGRTGTVCFPGASATDTGTSVWLRPAGAARRCGSARWRHRRRLPTGLMSALRRASARSGPPLPAGPVKRRDLTLPERIEVRDRLVAIMAERARDRQRQAGDSNLKRGTAPGGGKTCHHRRRRQQNRSSPRRPESRQDPQRAGRRGRHLAAHGTGCADHSQARHGRGLGSGQGRHRVDLGQGQRGPRAGTPVVRQWPTHHIPQRGRASSRCALEFRP